MWKLISKSVSIIWRWGQRSMSHYGHDDMIYTAWWQSTFKSKIISLCQRIKILHPRNENASKINLTLISKVTWKLWCYLTHRLIVAHLHRRYDKSMSKDKKVTTGTWLCEYLKKNHKKNPTKTIGLSLWKGSDIICLCWTCKYGQAFCPNIWMSLKEAIWILHILLTLP
jgi:hypothetical protein